MQVLYLLRFLQFEICIMLTTWNMVAEFSIVNLYTFKNIAKPPFSVLCLFHSSKFLFWYGVHSLFYRPRNVFQQLFLGNTVIDHPSKQEWTINTNKTHCMPWNSFELFLYQIRFVSYAYYSTSIFVEWH